MITTIDEGLLLPLLIRHVACGCALSMAVYPCVYRSCRGFACSALDCDGGSWSADAAKPVSVQVNSTTSVTVYYRGRRLLDAMIDYLLTAGLKDATNLLYSGCSAGGLTTYLHTDYVAGRMPPTVKVSTLSALSPCLFQDNWYL